MLEVQEEEMFCRVVSSSARKERKSRGGFFPLALGLLCCFFGAYFLTSFFAKGRGSPVVPVVSGVSVLRLAAAALRPRRSQIWAADFVLGTEALNPVFDRFGLARLVAVNLDKIRVVEKSRKIDLEALLKEDATTGNWRRDESATVAVLWNARVLHFLKVLVDNIIDDKERALDPTAIVDLASLAKRAYAETLHHYHSGILRSAAHARLAFAPDRAALFFERLGYSPEEWSSRFKHDLRDLSNALNSLLDHLRSLLRNNAHIDGLFAFAL